MNSRGVAATLPVLLGGAALTRSYVENDLSRRLRGPRRLRPRRLRGPAADGRDDGPRRGAAPTVDAAEEAKRAERKARHERSQRVAAQAAGRRGRDGRAAAGALGRRAATTRSRPRRSGAPGWSRASPWPSTPGSSTSAPCSWASGACAAPAAGPGRRYEELVETEGRPRLRYWLDRLATEGVLAHAAVVYGYFPAVAEGDALVVLDEPRPDAPERTGFTFPRQRRDRHLCLADFWRPRELAVATGEVDVLPLHLVTMGQPIADYANELFAKDAYRDYLEVHGLGVQLTEALAEYWHRRIREELAFADRRRGRGRGPGGRRGRTSSSATAVPATRWATAPARTSTTGPRSSTCCSPGRIGVDAVRGAAAAPRAVHRRARRPPPGGQVLQCRLNDACGATMGARGARRRPVGHGRHADRLREAVGRLAARHRPGARRRAERTASRDALVGGRHRHEHRRAVRRRRRARHPERIAWTGERLVARAPRSCSPRAAAGGPAPARPCAPCGPPGWPTALVTNTGAGLTELALDGIGREFFDVSRLRRRGARRASPRPIPTCGPPSCSGVPAAECLAVEDSPERRAGGRARRAPRCSSCRARCRCRPGRGGRSVTTSSG